MKVITQDDGPLVTNRLKNDLRTYCWQIVEGLKPNRVSRCLHGAKLKSKAIWERVNDASMQSKAIFSLVMLFMRRVLGKR